MTNINESVKKGPMMTMTLKCETEFPKALKNVMLSMGMQVEDVYKGFPVIDEGQEWSRILVGATPPIQEQRRRPQ
jgi:hypothetical protein